MSGYQNLYINLIILFNKLTTHDRRRVKSSARRIRRGEAALGQRSPRSSDGAVGERLWPLGTGNVVGLEQLSGMVDGRYHDAGGGAQVEEQQGSTAG